MPTTSVFKIRDFRAVPVTERHCIFLFFARGGSTVAALAWFVRVCQLNFPASQGRFASRAYRNWPVCSGVTGFVRLA